MSNANVPSGIPRDADEWRKRCPKGHADWMHAPNDYYCRTCELEFERLVVLHRPISLDSQHDV